MKERVLYGQEEDLVYNRSGLLSPRQAELSARPLRWAAVAVALSAVISLLVGVIAPLVFGMDRTTRLILGGALGLATFGELFVAWLILRSSRRQSERPIEVAEGRIAALPATRGGLPMQLKLGDRTITVPKPNLPLRAGGHYRAYGLTVPRRNVLMTYALVELEQEEEW